MFSTLHNQKRAEELAQKARSLIDAVESKFAETKARLLETVKRADEVRAEMIRSAIPDFKERFGTIVNEPEIDLPPMAETPIRSQIDPLLQRTEIKPITVPDLKGGKGGAFFLSLLVTLAVIAGAIAAAAVMLNMPLAPDTFTRPDRLEKILGWIGGGAFDPHFAKPIWGVVVLLIVAIAVWSGVKSAVLSKAARQNLETAEKVYQKAQAFAEEKSYLTEEMRLLDEALAQYHQALKALELFTEEYNAAMRRIAFTEGNDFLTYRPHSRQTIERAAALATLTIPILNTAIITSEGRVGTPFYRSLKHAELIVTALVDDAPLPTEAPQTVEVPQPERPTLTDATETEESQQEEEKNLEENLEETEEEKKEMTEEEGDSQRPKGETV
jgi:hypothetical protein